MEQIYRIGIDHGYGNIKTARHIFQSGVVQKGSITELSGMTVEYEGKFYEIGSTHKEYQMDKVWDEDYYVLTLAALAKELQGRGLCNASVILAAGLPIKWLTISSACTPPMTTQNMFTAISFLTVYHGTPERKTATKKEIGQGKRFHHPK